MRGPSPRARALYPGLLLSVTMLAGCGSTSVSAPLPTVGRPHRAAKTATVLAQYATAPPTSPATSAPVPTSTIIPAASATPGPDRPTARPAPAAVTAGRVLSAAVRPDTVQPGAAMSLSVITSGTVNAVDVYLGSGSPSGPAPITYTLAQTTIGAWSASGTAPVAPGQYHFSVGIFDSAGRRTIVDNDGYNIVVAGTPTSPPAALTFPADIPLAPPFSYSNPVPATFSADGRSVSGAEVVSNARTDVPTDTVAQFYETHLPRAGWAVDQSTVPLPGSTSFSIAATSGGASGTRVCIVQYSGSTVSVFYGTLTG